jgi:hypothetical protein
MTVEVKSPIHLYLGLGIIRADDQSPASRDVWRGRRELGELEGAGRPGSQVPKFCIYRVSGGIFSLHVAKRFAGLP